MGFPKKIKKHIPLIEDKTLYPRREELLSMINKHGTNLPKSILHSDLDRGFLDFVKDELRCVVEGNVIPMVDILLTNQNWSRFIETWDFENIDKNVEPPFLTVIRNPEVKFGTNPALMYNIPNRRQYYYAKEPTWDGQRHGYNIYKIPQPVPVDIKYTVVLVCNRMRELNQFNKVVLEKFASRQAYQNVKGHYIPIINDDIADESVTDLEKRRFYIQKYSFTMLGFLIDEDEFEVSPAISRTFQIYETDTATKKHRGKKPTPQIPSTKLFNYEVGVTEYEYTYNYIVNLKVNETKNVNDYDVYINNLYYGSNIVDILMNTKDVLKIVVNKSDNNKISEIELIENLPK